MSGDPFYDELTPPSATDLPVAKPGEPIQPVEVTFTRKCAFKKKPENPLTGGKQLGCEHCGKARNHIDHIGQPPSINVLGSGDRFAYQAMKKAWSKYLTDALIRAGLPLGLDRVIVEGRVTFPRRASAKGPDQGNHRAPLEKFLGDALEEGGWLPNDNWAHYEFGGLAFNYEAGVSRTELVIMAFAPPVGGAPDEDGQETLAF